MWEILRGPLALWIDEHYRSKHAWPYIDQHALDEIRKHMDHNAYELDPED